ncbi:MAG: exodeoxyribonuclease V subunit gamma [Chlamydiales bacterium]|nr:exodeoxyribonuclease V subunit gamma [Chlamydiales bacterium]
MKTFPTYIYSNRVEVLYEGLRNLLFCEDTDAFTKRIVIVPSASMKRFLMLRLAEDKKSGMAMGLHFTYVKQAVGMLSRSCFSYSFDTFTNKMALVFRLEMEIKKAFFLFSTLGVEQKAWNELFSYLQVDPQKNEKWPESVTKRLLGICNSLAELFLEYGITAAHMLQRWQENPLLDGYQSLLWMRIFSDNYPYKHLENIPFQSTKEHNIQVHIFCLSYIAKIYFNFFKELARTTPVYMHLLSPTPLFWTDTLTSRETLSLQGKWKKRKVKENTQNDLFDYVSNTNPLLSNFGKVGRKFFSMIEEEESFAYSSYVLPSPLAPVYEEWENNEVVLFEEALDKRLQKIQADILFMRNPRASVRVDVAKDDDSVQVYAAPSKYREVQILYEKILSIVSANQFLLDDVVVMAPSIAEYAPHIKAIFGCKESLMDFQLLDVKVAEQNSYAEGMLLLLGLLDNRWSVTSLMALLQHPQFQKKHTFSDSQVQEIEKWTRKMHLSWGNDNDHRKEMLQRLYGRDFDVSIRSTWEQCFEGIMKDLVGSDSESFAEESFTMASLLGKWQELLRSLRSDLRVLEDGSMFSLKEWSAYLKCLLQAYFIFNESKVQIEEWNYLIDKFTLLSKADYFLDSSENIKFSFVSIRPHLQEMLQEEVFAVHDNKLRAVRFCSLLPMRAIPAKVICLIGLNEEAFPRKNHKSLLDFRGLYKDSDYSPTSADYDRYLFLEALLSARSHFIMSYSKGKDEDSATHSQFITEFLSYNKNAFTVPLTVVNHPLDAFAASYFSKQNMCSQSAYALAKAYYKKDRCAPFRPFPDFFVHADVIIDPHSKENAIVKISDLKAALANPLKLYLNQELNLYLSQEEKMQDNEISLLSPLLLYQIKKASLRHPLEKIFAVLEKENKLSQGLFKNLSKKHIIEEVEKLHQELYEQGIGLESIVKIHLKEKCRKQTQVSYNTILSPPISIPFENGSVLITGKIEEISSKGLLSFRKDQFKEALKELPSYLVLHALQEVPSERALLFCKDGKKKKAFFENPFPLLQKLLSYYYFCRKNPLLFSSEWSEDMMKSASLKLKNKVKMALEEYIGVVDPYINFACNKDDLPSSDLLITKWQNAPTDIFKEVKSGWYGKDAEI